MRHPSDWTLVSDNTEENAEEMRHNMKLQEQEERKNNPSNTRRYNLGDLLSAMNHIIVLARKVDDFQELQTAINVFEYKKNKYIGG